MTLANMRQQGVRSPWVACELCHHEAVLNVDGYGDAVPVPALASAWSATAPAPSALSLGRIGRSGRCRRAWPAGSGS